ncbi:hypothetical protein TIFTF001_045680 [Ficus carica]|uniref:Uncharacterized protein n=1 Tax=Ficus carica TaxID=3494 RepID=A0AA88CIW7_FICCA|nr:hypothetical protein TIFTF001_045680 [Ficus carica]
MNRFGNTPNHDEVAQAATNEQCDDDDMLARAVVVVINSQWNRRRVLQPMHDSILTGSMRVEEILNGHEDVIQGMISMKSSTFRVLSNLLGLKVICALNDEFIRPPDYTTVQPLINENEGKYRPWFDIGDPFLEEYVADCVPVRGNDDVNADYMLDDGVDDTGPSTGMEQHGSSTGAMNQMRERMTDAMWERYQSYPWYRAT